MSEKSFVKYINLTVIKIRNTKYLNAANPIPKNIFRDLIKLNFLSIENIFTEFDPAFTLPPNLEKISLSENYFLEHIDLRNASSLTEFHAYDCSLRSFPVFSKLAPLTTVDVRWNPMDNWTAENLAPFCLLRNLSIEWGDNDRLTVPKRFCQCLRLENWIKTYNITTRYSLNCTPPACKLTHIIRDFGMAKKLPIYQFFFFTILAKETNCSTIYSEETLRQRRECLERYSEFVEQPWAFVIAASFFTIPISTIGYLQLRMQKTNVRRKRAPAEHGGGDHKKDNKKIKSSKYKFAIFKP